jgi:TrmH family RNA methyltransferase
LISKSDVKYIQSLAHKKFREEEGLFVVEGVKMVEELLIEYPEKIVHLYGTQSWFDGLSQFRTSQCPVSVIDDKMLNRISQLKTPNEVLALVKLPQQIDVGTVKNGVTVVLDQLQDPGNLGTIIRSCDWFGVENIVCSAGTVDAFNHKAVQSAKGSLLRVNINYTDLSAFLSIQKALPVYAAVLGGNSIHEVNFQQPAILVIGNEANGISKEILSFATDHITIPKKGKAESLNAAIATAVILSNMVK